MSRPVTIAANPRRVAVESLVSAHAKLEDRHTGAIWLSGERNGVWLVEVIPSMPADALVDQPIEFLPSNDFRYALRLYAGREGDLLSAIDRNTKFAKAIAEGTPIPKETASTKRLQARARKVLKGQS